MSEVVINSRTLGNIIDESKFSLFHFSVLILCFLTTSFEGYNLFLYGAVLPSITKEWSISSIQAGIIGSSGLIGMMLGSVSFGLLADKIGRKKVIIISVIFDGLFTALCSFINDPLLFSLFRFIAGSGIGGALPNVIALTTDYSPKVYRNTMIAIMLCGIQFGGILGPAATMATLENGGWSLVLLLGGISLFLIPFMIKLLPESYPFLQKKGQTEKIERILHKLGIETDKDSSFLMNMPLSKEQNPITHLFQGNRARSTIMFWIAYFMTLLMIYGLATWLPEIMLRAGFTMKSSLFFPIVLSVGCILGTFIFAAIADRWLKTKVLLIILYLIGAASLILLGLDFSLTIFYILIFVTGACIYGTQNIVSAYVSQYYPSSIRSTGVGLCLGVGRIGAIVGTVFWGMLVQWNLSVQAILLAFAVPSLFSALSFAIVKEDFQKEKEFI